MNLRKFRRLLDTLFATIAFICIPMAGSAWGAVGTDATVSKDQNSASKTVATPAFSTTSSNELLLAFISTDYLSGANTTVTSVAGGGLTWVLVIRTNAQSGTSEIWRAFAPSTLSSITVTATLSQSVASSLTVVSFSGADTSGTNGAGAIGATKGASAASGAPAATLVTTRNASWVYGVGNDFDNAVARSVGVNQSLVHQDLAPTGDTYWVQRQTVATPASGTSATINDTAPVADRYNLSIVEILPALAGGGGSASNITATSGGGQSATISTAFAAPLIATVNDSGNNPVAGVTVTFTAPGSGTSGTFAGGVNTATTNSSGVATSAVFTANSTAGGPYTVTATVAGVATPANFALTNTAGAAASVAATSGSGQSAAINTAFAAPLVATVKDSGNNPVPSVTVTFTAPGSGASGTFAGGVNTATTDSSGAATSAVFTANSTAGGPYTVTATVAGVPTPANFALTNTAGHSISGTISPASGGGGATVAISGGTSATATADGSGNFAFHGLADGSYTVTPTKSGYTFSPSNQLTPVSGSDVSGVNFTAQQVASQGTLGIDVNVSKDQGAASTTVATAPFSTASGNELLLAFVATDYLSGANTTVTGVSGGGLTWVLAYRTNIQSGTSEIWRAFAPAALTSATVTATLSQSVGSSLTLLSFTGVDTSGTNGSGAIGAVGSGNARSGAPSAQLVTTRNGSWVFGVGNDYDNAILRTPGAGQVVVHQDLSPAGDTYWVQRQSSPTPLSGATVTINDTAPTTDRYNLSIVEVLPSLTSGGGTPTPPIVSMAAPAPNSTLANKTTVAANAVSPNYPVTGVQFLLDGNNLGALVTASPYSTVWDTTVAAAGAHTLSAIAYNSAGLSATSNSTTVTVDNSGNPAVVGSWSSVVSLPTVAVNLILLKNNTVLFYQDGSSPTVWDYLKNKFTSVPAPADLWCSGQAALADGRILAVGGYGGSGSKIGIPNAEIFDPTNNSWTVVPKMGYSRWYPTATTLSDGRVLVTGGWQTTSHTNAGIPEVYDPASNTWTQLTNANNPFETYPFVYLLPDGRLVHVGGSEYPTVTDILNVATQSWSVVDSTIRDGGSASMYLPGKIMKAGSAADSQNVGSSSNTTYVLDMNQTNPSWQQTPSMIYPRTFLNLTTLPDDTVLVTGGETDKNGGDISQAVYASELWNPATQAWTTMSSMHTPREYHSTALLLPDGRVLVSGMGADGGLVPDQLSAEFYSPPYLFKGARPTISQAPAQVSYGQNFFVGTPDGATIASAVLIRTGAPTHFFDQNARYVPVTFQQTTGGLTLIAPANGNQAPPGYYMLFLVDANGVPSVAPLVQLR